MIPSYLVHTITLLYGSDACASNVNRKRWLAGGNIVLCSSTGVQYGWRIIITQ